jgi:hypothetical protein
MNTKFIWIPEAPKHPGLYANEKGTDMQSGKICYVGKQPSTRVIKDAKQFDTYKECMEWCNANPDPKFIPVEHGLY